MVEKNKAREGDIEHQQKVKDWGCQSDAVLDWVVRESFTDKVTFDLRLKEREREEMNLLGEECSELWKQEVQNR